jgi:hypothetical protein
MFMLYMIEEPKLLSFVQLHAAVLDTLWNSFEPLKRHVEYDFEYSQVCQSSVPKYQQTEATEDTCHYKLK